MLVLYAVRSAARYEAQASLKPGLSSNLAFVLHGRRPALEFRLQFPEKGGSKGSAAELRGEELVRRKGSCVDSGKSGLEVPQLHRGSR